MAEGKRKKRDLLIMVFNAQLAAWVTDRHGEGSVAHKDLLQTALLIFNFRDGIPRTSALRSSPVENAELDIRGSFF